LINLIWGRVFNLQTVGENSEPIILRSFTKKGYSGLMLCLGSTVVNHASHHPLLECSNPAISGLYYKSFMIVNYALVLSVN
jgi:hypothetical protein